jgi:predicted outer membrane repeat protein
MVKLLFILYSCFVVAISYSAQTIIVDATGTGDYPTIQAAIDAAVEGDTVELQPGVYTGDGNRDVDFKGKAITVRSIAPHDPNIVAATIINCNGTVTEPRRGFTFHSGETSLSVLSGLTITNGYGPTETPLSNTSFSAGGAILCMESSPTITYCRIRANIASGGDGIFCRNSNPTIKNCSIIGNPFTSRGGGIFLLNSNPTITDCSIINNSNIYHGGGIYCEDSDPVMTGCLIADNSAGDSGGGICTFTTIPNSRGLTIDRCTIAGNRSYRFGGGICCQSATSPKITRCIITGNSAASSTAYMGVGGGIDCIGTREPVITECIFSDNRAGGLGGAIACGASGTKILNCTIVNNWAGSRGGGFGYQNTNFTNVLNNCILWGNTAPAGPQVGGTSTVGGPIIKYNNIEGGYKEPGNIDVEPQFAIDGYHLLPQSPCVDAGDPNTTRTAEESDIDSQSRIIGAGLDIGADEVDANAPSLIGFFPKLLRFKVPETGPNPPPQSLYVHNVGSGLLNWQLTEDCPWLSVTPTRGTVSTEPNEVTLTVDASGLERGTYDCRFTISDPNCANNPQTCFVLLTVMGPRIDLSQTQFTFEAVVAGLTPEDQSLIISNSGSGTLNWQLTNDSQCDWLKVSPQIGTVGQQSDQVVLSADQNDLKPGQYQCTLTISDPNAENNPQIIDVSLTVARPKIQLSSSSFTFRADSPASKPDAQKLLITNVGAGVLNWQITTDCNWLKVYPTTGHSAGEPNEVTLTVDPALVGPGQYNCTLAISDPNAGNSPRWVTISLKVGPKIYCQPSTLTFYSDSAPVPAQTMNISNIGAGNLNWRITWDCNWVEVYPTTGRSAAGELNKVTITVNPAGFQHGVYGCTLTLSDPNAENSPQLVTISLKVGPEIYYSPSLLVFNANIAPTKSLYISNTGAGTLNWQITSDCNWVEVSPTTGQAVRSARYSNSVTVTVTVNPAGFDHGIHKCILTVSDPNAANSPLTVPVYYVSAGACFPAGYSEFTDWVVLGGPECWCKPYQCDGDADGKTEGFFKYRIYSKDLSLVVENWKRKIDDPKLNPCADIDHLAAQTYRVYSNDLAIVITNWKKKDTQLPGNCPRSSIRR